MTFAGADHVALTVTDLDVSQDFYTRALDFVPVLDVGYGRVLMHPTAEFTLSVLRHEGAHGGAFSELATGLDHLGFRAGSREDLEAWADRFEALGVRHSPIRDMDFGHHLSFRDPDDVALELFAPNELMLLARRELAAGRTSHADVVDFIDEHQLDLPGGTPGAGSGGQGGNGG